MAAILLKPSLCVYEHDLWESRPEVLHYCEPDSMAYSLNKRKVEKALYFLLSILL